METERTPGDTMSNAEANACCVVFSPPGRGIDEPLSDQLDARNWRATPVDDPHLAMAELCLLDRTAQARRASGDADSGELALVIVPPQAGDAPCNLKDLVAAVKRYLPDTSVWLYMHGGLSSLKTGAGRPGPEHTSGDAADTTEPDAESLHRRSRPTSAPPTSARPPDLHLAGAGREAPALAPADAAGLEDEDLASAQPRITAEELEMLFEHDPNRETPTQ